MEKIQAAIAKARATRKGEAAPDAPVSAVLRADRPEIPADPAPGVGVAEAWAALLSFAPDPRRLVEAHVVTQVGCAEASPFDALRTRVLQQMRAQGWRRLAITSPGPACGKSTLALNLAFSLARQPDLRVILAEVDLRRPSLSRILGHRPSNGFADVLRGTQPFADQALRFGNNLAIALSPIPVHSPAELLHSPGVTEVLANIDATYAPDITIFDLPPMLASDDVMAFLGQVDCALLVAAAEASTVKEVDVCERDIASRSNVLGVVLNKCRYRDTDYGYDYGY